MKKDWKALGDRQWRHEDSGYFLQYHERRRMFVLVSPPPMHWRTTLDRRYSNTSRVPYSWAEREIKTDLTIAAEVRAEAQQEEERIKELWRDSKTDWIRPNPEQHVWLHRTGYSMKFRDEKYSEKKTGWALYYPKSRGPKYNSAGKWVEAEDPEKDLPNVLSAMEKTIRRQIMRML